MTAANILITEDVAANIALYKIILERAGYGVDVAETGEAATEMASNKRYDLILMDIGLPGIDGAEAARRIRISGAPSAQSPIIALTADDDGRIRKACKEVGMNDYLTKPLSPATMLGMVAKMVN